MGIVSWNRHNYKFTDTSLKDVFNLMHEFHWVVGELVFIVSWNTAPISPLIPLWSSQKPYGPRQQWANSLAKMYYLSKGYHVLSIQSIEAIEGNGQSDHCIQVVFLDRFYITHFIREGDKIHGHYGQVVFIMRWPLSKTGFESKQIFRSCLILLLLIIICLVYPG